MKRRLETLLVNALLALGACLCAAPLLWMVSVSLMPSGEATASSPSIATPVS